MHTQFEINALDRALDGGAKTLERELRECERESMQEMVEPFSAALEADLITADDFR